MRGGMLRHGMLRHFSCWNCYSVQRCDISSDRTGRRGSEEEGRPEGGLHNIHKEITEMKKTLKLLLGITVLPCGAC